MLYGEYMDFSDQTRTNERTNEVYLPMNVVNNDWLPVESEKYKKNKKKLTNKQTEKDRERKRKKNKINCYT